MWTTVDKGFDYSTRCKDTIPPEMSLFDFCCQQLEQADFTAEEKAACKEFAKFWGAYVGEPVERQSMKFFCLEECIEGSECLSIRVVALSTDFFSSEFICRIDI